MRGIIRSLLVSVWFMFLTFPIMVIKVVPHTGEVLWRWKNCVIVGVGSFLLAFVWRALMVKKGQITAAEADLSRLFNWLEKPRNVNIFNAVLALAAGAAPLALLFSGDRAPDRGSLVAAVIWAVLCLAFAGVNLAGKRQKASAGLKAATSTITAPGLPRNAALVILLALMIPLPFLSSIYQTNVLTQTFIWVMLGLGLNIVVGQAGLLVLGYVAFYAVGAYAYAILNQLYGWSFWLCLPIGGVLAALAGVLLSLPVMRLRGDYLAIVTLGFGEIVRLVLQAGSLSFQPVLRLYLALTHMSADFLTKPLSRKALGEFPQWMSQPLDLGGPAGISGIPYPTFFGKTFNLDDSVVYVYFIALGMMILTIFAVARLRDSRLGRSWMALREDEIACEAMGIDKVRAKLTAFALGACWAGFGGVLFAAKTTYINPTSFTFMESALILSVVVLGGLGSILGVVLGAAILILLPEYLRAFEEYRMLIFGASMVLMMVFRPQGLIAPQKKPRVIHDPAGPLDGIVGANPVEPRTTEPVGGDS